MRALIFAAFISLGLWGCGPLDESELAAAANTGQALEQPPNGEELPMPDVAKIFPAPAWTDPSRRVSFQESFMYTTGVTQPCPPH